MAGSHDQSPVGLPPTVPRLVYVVDDEREMRISLSFMLKTFGIASRPFAAAEDFLAEVSDLRPGCLIVDIRMPSKDGLSLLAEMAAAGMHWQTIVITGHADVSIAVRSMKLGAVDFLEKPFKEEDLLAALDRAFSALSRTAAEHELADRARSAIQSLTPRERDVLEGLVDGLSNKEIAARLGLSPRTVEMHRTNLMRRAGAGSMSELLSLAYSAGIRNSAAGASGSGAS